MAANSALTARKQDLCPQAYGNALSAELRIPATSAATVQNPSPADHGYALSAEPRIPATSAATAESPDLRELLSVTDSHDHSFDI